MYTNTFTCILVYSLRFRHVIKVERYILPIHKFNLKFKIFHNIKILPENLISFVHIQIFA